MSLEARIELLSEAAIGSGFGNVGIDQDVSLDHYGLPAIPGRRLKGLLREATTELFEALSRSDGGTTLVQKLMPLPELFGTAQRPGAVHIGTARFAGGRAWGDAVDLQEWIAYWRDLIGEKVEHLFDAGFTAVRAQTAIDLETGAARESSLRTTRVFARGLRFRAPIEIASGSPEKVQRTLALGCAALQRMGTSRNRGFGRVRVHLWQLPAADLTEVYLTELETSNRKGVRGD